MTPLCVKRRQLDVLVVRFEHELFQTFPRFGQERLLPHDIREGASEFVNPWIG